MPDSVLVCAEPGAFVTQTTLKTLDERTVTGRILGVGGSLFYELEAQELASVLAHEFAHFSGKDTLYSNRVLPVFRTISSVLDNLKFEGSGSSVELIINVLLLVPRFCVLTFVRYFAAIDSLLTRARELRADLLAAETFGDQPFKSALAKLTRSLLFYHEKLVELKPSANLFEHLHHQMESCAVEVHELAAEETRRGENEFDSHPSLQTRLDSLPRVEVDYLRNVSMRQVLQELSPTLERLSARLNLLFFTTETDEDDDEGEDGVDAECADVEETE